MTERKTVPVAYVTKWAETRGILVVRDAETSAPFPDHLRHGLHLLNPAHWTTDKAEAEKRYRAALKAARASAVKKAKSLAGRMKAEPLYVEEE